MQKYEYTALVVPPTKALHKEINKFAARGWRLFETKQQHFVEKENEDDAQWIVIFEREVI